jgi:hypothetical protein
LGYKLGQVFSVARPHARDALDARWEIVVDPEGARVVRRIFELRDTGLIARQIAEKLEKEGVGMSRTHPNTRLIKQAIAAEERGDHRAAAILRAEGVLIFPGMKAVHAVLDREELYRTGRRVWNGIEARQRWPTILPPSSERQEGQERP